MECTNRGYGYKTMVWYSSKLLSHIKPILTKAYEVAGIHLEPNQSDLENVCTFLGLLNYSKHNNISLHEPQWLNVYELQRLFSVSLQNFTLSAVPGTSLRNLTPNIDIIVLFSFSSEVCRLTSVTAGVLYLSSFNLGRQKK